MLFAGLPPALTATENGTTAFPNGGEDFFVAGMPPPGWYAQIYATHYHADFLADDAGHMPLTGFDLKADAATFRLDWIKRVSVLGADRWGTLLIAPVIDLDLFLNPATDYHSGQTLYLNWAIGWKPVSTLTLGVAGYFLRQFTNDEQGGRMVGPAGNKARVGGIGPCVKYFLPNHVMLTAKYFRESAVRNHPKGDQFWIYAAIPLGVPRPAESVRPK